MRSHQHLSYAEVHPTEQSHSVDKHKHNYMYMIPFAIEYSYALSNVFVGPLFLNIIAGVILDSVIWGIPPMLFFLFQNKLRQLISASDNVYRTRFFFLTFFTGVALVSYAGINYNETFKWNYFNKIVNLDVGYIMLDLSCKIIYFIFVYEQQEENRGGSFNNLKFSFIAHICCYFIGFYISFNLNTNGLHYYRSLQICSLVGCAIVVPIPVYYYYKNKDKLQAEEVDAPQIVKHNWKYTKLENITYLPINQKVQIVSTFLTQCSLITNLAYSTLWVMDSLKKLGVAQGQAFTQTIMYGTFYFLISTLVYISSGYLLRKNPQKTKPLAIGFNLVYSLLVLACYFRLEAHQISLVIVGTGLQLSIANSLEDNSSFSELVPTIVIMAEFVVFCMVPVVLSILGSDELQIYILISGLSCLGSAVLLNLTY